ncbi:carboxylesterase domain protein, partial [Staphylococcus warneri VCU121]
DVRQLGRFLQKKGYTSYAPQYEGHAAPPEEILKSSPYVWFKDVLDGYQYLVDQGYDEIDSCGIIIRWRFCSKIKLKQRC